MKIFESKEEWERAMQMVIFNVSFQILSVTNEFKFEEN